MSPRKRVPTLRKLSTLRLSALVEDLALTSAFALISAGYEANGGSERIRRHIETFKDHLAALVNADTVQEVSEAVLNGAAAAADARRAVGKREGDNKYLTSFMQEMFCVVEFVAAAALPAVASLDLDKAPKIVRSRLFELLPLFPSLRVLRLGSGSGGTSEVLQPKVLNGVFLKDRLTVFSLNYDCNDDIIKMLRKNCANSLRVLDIEYSSQVTDCSIDDICLFRCLCQLHIFHTGLTPWGQAAILRRLRHTLRILVRGDFLCEALQVMETEAEERNEEPPELLLEEFWSSEDYYFHDAEQMRLVNRVCPRMRKIMFQFSRESAGDFLVLSPFTNLTELHSWGGDFYSDRLCDLLDRVGLRLRVLYLIHVDELDARALAALSRDCAQLETLGLYNCIFRELTLEDMENYMDRAMQDRLGPTEMQPMLSVSKLAVVSECSWRYLLQLLAAAINVREIITGNSTEVDDKGIGEVLLRNRLTKLETIKISQSKGLSIQTAHLFVEECPNLRSLRDLEGWSKVNKMELWLFREHLRENNLDVDTGEEEWARSKLDTKRLTAEWEGRAKVTHFWSRETETLQQIQ